MVQLAALDTLPLQSVATAATFYNAREHFQHFDQDPKWPSREIPTVSEDNPLKKIWNTPSKIAQPCHSDGAAATLRNDMWPRVPRLLVKLGSAAALFLK
jgi:hypothetical protein